MHQRKQQAHTKYASVLDEIEQYAVDFTAKRTPLESYIVTKPFVFVHVSGSLAANGICR